jgi:hypothetical protein
MKYAQTISLHGYFKNATNFVPHKYITTVAVRDSKGIYNLFEVTKSRTRQVDRVNANNLTKAMNKANQIQTIF